MDFYLQWFERLPSTNRFLKERLALEPGLRSGTVVAAREQTEGRGRRDRSWFSGANENLAFSVLLKGNYAPGLLPSVSMAAAIAVAELLESEGLCPVLKWPNDVLVQTRKICGILADGVPGGVVVGIGLNVNLEAVSAIDQPATSLRIETGRRHSVDAVLQKLLSALGGWMEQWRKNGFAAMRPAWESRIPGIGQPVTVRDGDSVRRGILHGFGPCGELLLTTPDNAVHAIWAGDCSLPLERD